MEKQEITAQELQQLKNKLPKKYNPLVRKAYLKLSGKTISERSVFGFFAGEIYSTELHNAALHVAEIHQSEISLLSKRTKDLLSQ